MRSKLLQIFDYREVDISAFAMSFSPDMEAVQRELMQLANRKAVWKPVQYIQKGDLAVCRLSSQHPRFQKEQIKLMVGQGLFHRELEAQLLGLQVGQEAKLQVEETWIQVQVLSVLRKSIPEITDELIRSGDPRGPKTVEEYQKNLCLRQLEKAVEEKSGEVVQYILNQVHESSTILITREDWQRFVDNELERNRQLVTLDGLVLENMTPQQFEGRIPVSSYYELVTWVQRDSWDSLEQTLLGQYYARQNGALLSPEAYGQFLQAYAETWKLTEKTARSINTQEQYENSYYSSYYYGLVAEHVRNWLMKSAQENQ